jgi:hypothetical protein
VDADNNLSKFGPLLKSNIMGNIPQKIINALLPLMLQNGNFIDIFGADRMLEVKYPLDPGALGHAAIQDNPAIFKEYLKHLDGRPLKIHAMIRIGSDNTPLLIHALSKGALKEFLEHAGGDILTPLQFPDGSFKSPILIALEQNCLPELLANKDTIIGPTTDLVSGQIGTQTLL